MRMLVVAPRFPYPTRTGDTLTVFHLLRHFSQRHRVDLVSCIRGELPPESYSAIADYCGLIRTVQVPAWRSVLNSAAAVLRGKPLQPALFASGEVRRAISDLVREQEYDVLYAHTVRVAQYLADLPMPVSALRVLAMQISMKLNYQRLARYERNPLYRLAFQYEASRLGNFERQLVDKFDRTLVISQVDQRAVSPDSDDRFFECPHGVTLDDQPEPAEERQANAIVFSGNMNYRPNVDAVIYFYQEIFPQVRQRVPDAEFFVVGANPDASIRRLKDDRGVHVTGEVPSIYPWLHRAAVGIDPLRAGAGLQNKVLEGMACGLPMVITPVANEGIRATHEVHLLMADNPAEFARHIVRLMEDSGLRESIGRAARCFIETHWSWEAHFDRLEAMLIDELNARRASTGRSDAPG